MRDNQKPYLERRYEAIEYFYNKDYGDDRICICGHPYYRHFDSYDNMGAVGCKYCECDRFVEDTTEVKKETVWSDLYSINKIRKEEEVADYYVFSDLSNIPATDWLPIMSEMGDSDEYRIVSVPLDLEVDSKEFYEYIEEALWSRIDTAIFLDKEWAIIAECYKG